MGQIWGLTKEYSINVETYVENKKLFVPRLGHHMTKLGDLVKFEKQIHGNDVKQAVLQKPTKMSTF
jgi:hypothetical protein